MTKNGVNVPNASNPSTGGRPNGVNVDKESYVEHLLKTLKEQTNEMNKMQQRIKSLEKAVGTRKLLEEDFHSFVSRIEFPSWVSDKQRAVCLNKLFEHERKKLQMELDDAKLRRSDARSRNLELETEVIQLVDDISTMRDELEAEKHKNYLGAVNYNKNLAAKLARNGRSGNGGGHTHWKKNGDHSNGMRYGYHGQRVMDYPPENIIIQTLIRTQIEFYFSDFNLKRDKRLLDQLCSDRIGYLKIESVMNLTRVRQLLSHRNQVVDALQSSKFLKLTPDREWVGRENFKRPQEKQFPFRRTVFVFGLPIDCDEKYVYGMLTPFGKLSKVTFDHGPDTLDRLVSETMFQEIRVYRYRDPISKVVYNYKLENMVGGSSEYICRKCKKTKQCEEGFYEANSYQTLICLQCTASSSEANLERARASAAGNRRFIEGMCGRPPREVKETRTALAVFTSQRQASKCVYVRSRIAHDGCFATHYHHYSKCKKEIALTLQPYKEQLKQIPPRRVLDLKRNGDITKELEAKLDHTNDDEKEGEDEKIVVTDVELSSDEDKGVDGNGDKLEKAMMAPIRKMPNMNQIRTVPMFSKEDHSKESRYGDDVKSDEVGTRSTVQRETRGKGRDGKRAAPSARLNAPNLRAKSDGSMTAPVVGGAGDLYLMEAAYKKINCSGHSQGEKSYQAPKGKHSKQELNDDAKQNK